MLNQTEITGIFSGADQKAAAKINDRLKDIVVQHQ